MKEMEFRTVVDVPQFSFEVEPCEEMFFVGSCFADSIGQRAQQAAFRATVNPYGVMYNPASVLHTVKRWLQETSTDNQSEAQHYGMPSTVFLTLGTNHVYRLKETGEIVDNCQKRPQNMFDEEQLSTESCVDYLQQTIDLLCQRQPKVNVVLTVSPIRYRKYGYHGSQLSKAVLLMAVERVIKEHKKQQHSLSSVSYFPAYEIVLDELRDYRFYKEDMLHPSDQAVDYIWQRLSEACFSETTKSFLHEWEPIRQALSHRPFDADSEAYREFRDKTMLKVAALRKNILPLQIGIKEPE